MNDGARKAGVPGSLEIHIPGACWVGMGSMVGAEVRAGPGCVIGSSARLVGAVRLGANVQIGDEAVLEGPLTVGDDCWIGRRTKIGFHNCPAGRQPTVIGRRCQIGRGVFIPNGVTVGEHAFIKAETVLLGDVPAHGLVGGGLGALLDFLCPCGGVLDPFNDDGLLCLDCGREMRASELDFEKIDRILLAGGEVGNVVVRPEMYMTWLGLEEF